jgi:hypothetical protein
MVDLSLKEVRSNRAHGGTTPVCLDHSRNHASIAASRCFKDLAPLQVFAPRANGHPTAFFAGRFLPGRKPHGLDYKDPRSGLKLAKQPGTPARFSRRGLHSFLYRHCNAARPGRSGKAAGGCTVNGFRKSAE